MGLCPCVLKYLTVEPISVVGHPLRCGIAVDVAKLLKRIPLIILGFLGGYCYGSYGPRV